MSILTQKTISKKLSFEGIGIHTGLKSKIDILPAEPNTGIVFKRKDLKINNIVYPLYNNVSDTTLCTTISTVHPMIHHYLSNHRTHRTHILAYLFLLHLLH